jgi:hypothetical protein
MSMNPKTVRQISEKFPAFTEPSLRWALFNAKANGLASAIVRIGRRVLIDEEKFVAWLEQHRQEPSAPAVQARR